MFVYSSSVPKVSSFAVCIVLVILASVVLPVDRFRVSGGVPIAPVYSAYNAMKYVDSQ